MRNENTASRTVEKIKLLGMDLGTVRDKDLPLCPLPPTSTRNKQEFTNTSTDFIEILKKPYSLQTCKFHHKCLIYSMNHPL